MITLKQIAFAINERLSAILPDVEIQSKDITEGYPRPCLYVDFDDVKTSANGAMLRERSVSVIIYYFPSDRNKHKIELLDVQETLEAAFTGHFPLTEEVVVQIFDINSVKVDGVLQLSFDIYTLEVKDDDSEAGPDMLELSIELGE